MRAHIISRYEARDFGRHGLAGFVLPQTRRLRGTPSSSMAIEPSRRHMLPKAPKFRAFGHTNIDRPRRADD